MGSRCGSQTIRTVDDSSTNLNTAAATVAYSSTNQLVIGYVSVSLRFGTLRAVVCTSASGGCGASVLIDTAVGMTANVAAAFGPDDGLPVLAYSGEGSVRMAQCTDSSCVQYDTSTVDQSPLDSEAPAAGRITVIPDSGDFFTFTPQRKPLFGYRASILQSSSSTRLDFLAFVTCGSCGLDDNNNGVGDNCETTRNPGAPPTTPPTSPTRPPTRPPTRRPTAPPTLMPTSDAGCSDAAPCSNGGTCDDGACACVPRAAADGSTDRVCFTGAQCTVEVPGCPSNTVACNANAGTTADTCVAGILDSDALNRGDAGEDDDSGMSSGVVVLIVFLVLACTAGAIAVFMYVYKGREPAEKIVVLSSVNPGFNPGFQQRRESVVPGAQGYITVGEDVDERQATIASAPGGVYGGLRKAGRPERNTSAGYNNLDHNLDAFENYNMTDVNDGYLYEEPANDGVYSMASAGNASKSAAAKGGKKGGAKKKQAAQPMYAMGDGTSDGVRDRDAPKKRSTKGAKQQPEQPMYAMGDGVSDGVSDITVAPKAKKRSTKGAKKQPEQPMYAMGDGASDGVVLQQKKKKKQSTKKQPEQAMYAMGDGTSDNVVISATKKTTGAAKKAQASLPTYDLGGFGAAGSRTDETPTKSPQSVYDFNGMDSPYDSRTMLGANTPQVGPGVVRYMAP